jgi:hypothetical protein
MPRISGRSSLTTISPTRFRPSERNVSRWSGELPTLERIWVTFNLGIYAPADVLMARIIAAGATRSSGRPRRAAIAAGSSRFFSAVAVA